MVNEYLNLKSSLYDIIDKPSYFILFDANNLESLLINILIRVFRIKFEDMRFSSVKKRINSIQIFSRMVIIPPLFLLYELHYWSIYNKWRYFGKHLSILCDVERSTNEVQYDISIEYCDIFFEDLKNLNQKILIGGFFYS